MNAIVKKRTLHISGFHSEEERSQIEAAILSLTGVRAVELAGDGTVVIEYDLMEINLAEIEEAIKSGTHHSLKSGLVGRLRRAFIHNAEQNEMDYLTAPSAPCCSNPRFCSYDRNQTTQSHS